MTKSEELIQALVIKVGKQQETKGIIKVGDILGNNTLEINNTYMAIAQGVLYDLLAFAPSEEGAYVSTNDEPYLSHLRKKRTYYSFLLEGHSTFHIPHVILWPPYSSLAPIDIKYNFYLDDFSLLSFLVTGFLFNDFNFDYHKGQIIINRDINDMRVWY